MNSILYTQKMIFGFIMLNHLHGKNLILINMLQVFKKDHAFHLVNAIIKSLFLEELKDMILNVLN